MGYQDVVVQPGEIVQQKWNDEQINDFVRKLGFLDVEGAVGDQINQFLCLNQVWCHSNLHIICLGNSPYMLHNADFIRFSHKFAAYS